MHFGMDLIKLNTFLQIFSWNIRERIFSQEQWCLATNCSPLADSVVYMLNNCTTISLCLRHNCFIPRHKIILVPPTQNFHFKILFKAHGCCWIWLFQRDIFLSRVEIFLKYPVKIFCLYANLILYGIMYLVPFEDFQFSSAKMYYLNYCSFLSHVLNQKEQTGLELFVRPL